MWFPVAFLCVELDINNLPAVAHTNLYSPFINSNVVRVHLGLRLNLICDLVYREFEPRTLESIAQRVDD